MKDGAKRRVICPAGQQVEERRLLIASSLPGLTRHRCQAASDRQCGHAAGSPGSKRPGSCTTARRSHKAMYPARLCSSAA